MTQDTLLADFERYLDGLRAEDPDLRVEVAPVVYQRPYRIADDAPIVRSMARAHQLVTGAPAEISDGLPASAYVTDAPDFVRHGAATVVYGPGDWKVEPNERIRIADMLTAAKTYAVAIAGIVSGESGSF
jgi:acetylornithine deacetylase/succinyl-diaminopimelate desuccinylase-like protein